MKIRNRILSFLLSIAFFISVFSGFPLMEVSAAKPNCDITIPSVVYIGDQFVIEGEATYNKSKIDIVNIAIYENDSMSNGVWCFRKVGLNARSFDFQESAKLFEWGDIIDSVNPNSTNPPFDTGAYESVYVEVIVKAQDGTSTKKTQTISVRESNEKLDSPKITSPDVDDTFYAGEDIKFSWTNVREADRFEWELHKLNQNGKYTKIDGGYTNKPVTIDGDTFKARSSYKFQIRSCCGNSTSEWNDIIIYIDASPELSADPDSLVFSSDKGEKYFDLTSSHEWEAEVSVDWIDLSSYDGDGDEEITVYVDKNTGEHRTGVIIITNDVVGSIEIIIQQDSGIAPYLNVSPTSIMMPSEDGARSFVITSNISWEIFCESDWIRNISQEDGYGNESIQILANENTSTQSRTAIITIEGDGITRTVTVTQDGRPAIVGDINNDGEITNKDRFLLNRYIANMTGYTDIDKTLADINGDGSVTEADVEYLTRYLAGWVGYEKLPEINTGTSVCAHTQYTDTYFNTVYVSSTIKTNTTHTYYHVYNRKCSCGVDIGKVQGDLITEAHSYVNNLCACGAYNDASYEKWTGVNVSDAQANVYSTPSATVRYGYINKNEVVTVIGEYGDKYLIEYTLDGGNGVKQGYVNKETLLVQMAKQYEASHSDYAHKHKICTYRTDGILLSVLDVEEHIFNKTEITYRYVDNGNSSHSIYADQYDICECGYSKLVATEIFKTTAPHSASNNDKYVCRLCAGNIHYISNPTPNTSYAINYQGTKYPISFPDYDYTSGSNYDITFGGWSTVYEKVYNDRKWDIANFVGNLELDDESYLLAGIALTEQLLTNLVHTDFIKVVLQKNETTGKNRALILIGDNSSINRGEVGSNKCLYIQCTNNMAFTGNNVPPYVNYNDGKEIADWLVRSSGISLPSEGWSIDDKLLYNVDIVYSNNWNTFDNYYKYLSFNEKGEAVTIERIMSGDRYQLTAYEDDSLLQIILNDLPIINSLVRPYLTENIKNYFVQPIQADSGEFIAKFSEEFNIVKITK